MTAAVRGMGWVTAAAVAIAEHRRCSDTSRQALRLVDAGRCSFKGWEQEGQEEMPSAVGVEGTSVAPGQETRGSEDSCSPSVPRVQPTCLQACVQKQWVEVRKRGRSPKKKKPAHMAGRCADAAANLHCPSAGVSFRTEVTGQQQLRGPVGMVGLATATCKQTPPMSSHQMDRPSMAEAEPSVSARHSAASHIEASDSGGAVAPVSPFIAPSPFPVRRRREDLAGATIVTVSVEIDSDHGGQSETGKTEVIVID